MRFVLHLIFIAAFVFTEPTLAQKLVDPNSVAPEFRDAAEKRRAEQIKVVEVTARPMKQRCCPGIELPTSTIAWKLPAKSRIERSAAFTRGSCACARPEEQFARDGVHGGVR